MSIRSVLLAIAAMAFMAGSALAQDKPAAKTGAAKAKGADRVCAADRQKFCSDVRPGGGRMYKCMSSHDAELAPACRERLTQGKARWDDFVTACKADADKYCKGVPPGGARIVSCLKGHQGDLAADCKAKFNRAQGDTTITQ